MSVREVVDVRKEYAERLRDIARQIESGDMHPVGLFVHVFYAGVGGVTTLEKSEPGLNTLSVAGYYLRRATTFADYLVETETEV